ncbi:MAG TPA: hypothetical protein VFZ56_05275 [Gemmatimonadaceae bacterium]
MATCKGVFQSRMAGCQPLPIPAPDRLPLPLLPGLVTRVRHSLATSGCPRVVVAEPAFTPILYLKAGYTTHVLEVGRDESGAEGDSVRSGRRIEVLDPCAAPRERGLDASVRVTDRISPHRPRNL